MAAVAPRGSPGTALASLPPIPPLRTGPRPPYSTTHRYGRLQVSGVPTSRTDGCVHVTDPSDCCTVQLPPTTPKLYTGAVQPPGTSRSPGTAVGGVTSSATSLWACVCVCGSVRDCVCGGAWVKGFGFGGCERGMGGGTRGCYCRTGRAEACSFVAS